MQSIKNDCRLEPLLNYDQMTYQNSYPKEFMIGFDHSHYKEGGIDREKVKEIMQQLNQCCKKDAPKVYFSMNKIEKNLSGGSCSSLAFKVVLFVFDLLDKGHTPLEFCQKMKEE